MSGFQPPPPGNFRPPPPPGGGGFVPPPPGGAPRPASGFAPPPPQMGGAPLPPQHGGFAPPPPGGGGTNQLNQQMGGMSFQGGPPAPRGPPPPGQFQAPPGQFQAPGPPGAPQGPPGQFGQQTQAPPGAPGMFQPPPPGAPAAPGMFQPPPPGASQAPPPPGGAAMPGGGATPVSSSFYQAPPNQGQRPAQPGGPGAAPGAPSQSQVFQENIDLSIKIPKRLFRFSSDKVAQTSAIASASKIPLGGVVRPLAPIPADEEQIATVQPGAAGIIRCKRCRTYINAFVHWVEHGRRWRCNICAQMNETPAAYFCHLDDQGLRRDRAERPELSKGVVEFIAPAEYMVRPPQEPSYFFVIDVSATAVRSGMLAHAANAIKSSLDELPGRTRTKVGFITFDNSVHYYNLGSDLAQPQMLVVSDLQELFVPLPDNLLVNLQESRDVVESFLDNLPDMFSKNPVVSRSCLGPALKAAFTVMKQIGGKMCVFQTIMPNTGDGSLKPRENPGLMGTPNEVQLLRPETQWYKDTAIEFSRQQISVDMFLFPYQYMDLAALGELPKLTSGSLHSYVSFNPEKDGQRFEEQLVKVLTQPTAFEAVMRIRCSKGMRITNFYGNFYIRGTDLMALPNVNADSVFGFDLSHDEQNVASNYVTVQAALLYTSSDGQRRIRVMTQALAVTSLTSDLIASVDPLATMNLLSKQAVDVSVKTTIDNARIRLQQSCVDILKAAKGGDKRTVSGYAVPKGSQPGEDEDKPLPDNLQLLPLYTLALMKNVAFRGGTDVHPDERIQAHHLINQMWVSASEHYIYPRLFSLHDMDQDAGYSLEETADVDSKDACAGHDRIALPRVVSLSIDGLTSNGIYLLDNGFSMFVWVGRSADQNLVNSLFGVPSLEDVDPALINLLTSGDDYSSRIGAIVEALREDDADPYVVSSQIQIIREGDGHTEARFFWFLVEDRASFQGGTYNYEEFMHFVQNAGGPGGAAPPGPGGPGPRGAPPGPQRGGPMPPGPSQQNYGAPPPQMGQSGPPAPAYNQGPPAPPSNQGPPAPAYNQGPPAPAYNQGPPAPAYNQGPPAPAYNQGPPAPAYNQGPPAPAYNQPPGPSYSQGPPGGPPQHSQGPPPPQQAPPPNAYGGPPPNAYGGPPPPNVNGAPPPKPAGGMPPPPGRAVGGPPPPPGPPRGGPPPPPGPPRGGPPPPPGRR